LRWWSLADRCSIVRGYLKHIVLIPQAVESYLLVAVVFGTLALIGSLLAIGTL